MWIKNGSKFKHAPSHDLSLNGSAFGMFPKEYHGIVLPEALHYTMQENTYPFDDGTFRFWRQQSPQINQERRQFHFTPSSVSKLLLICQPAPGQIVWIIILVNKHRWIKHMDAFWGRINRIFTRNLRSFYTGRHDVNKPAPHWPLERLLVGWKFTGTCHVMKTSAIFGEVPGNVRTLSVSRDKGGDFDAVLFIL